MLSEYEAAMLAKQKSADLPLAQATPARNRIGAVLLALSVLSAVGLLHSAFFHRGHVASAARVPAAPVATPIIHPAATGLPEASLFLRHASEPVQTAAEMAATAR